MALTPTNRDRAGWAKEALSQFTARTFSDDQPDTMHSDDLECAVADLIADLLHFAYQHDFDTVLILGRAHAHFINDMLDELRS